MTTPPQSPGGGGDSTAAALRALTLQLQAMLHQQQTYANLPSSAQPLRQARQGVTPPQGGSSTPSWAAGLTGGRTPTPAAPTTDWLRQAAQSFVSQVVLNQRQQSGGGAAPGPTPPTVMQPAQAARPYGGVWPGPGGVPGQWSPMPGATMPGMPPMAYPGMPVVTPSQAPGGGGGGAGGHSGASTGIGNWARNQLPMLGARIGGPWGAVAGAGIAAATQLPAEIRSQRDKNAFYQSVEGGSNFDGFKERGHEEAYRWSTAGVFSSDEARRAFKGVTKLGYGRQDESGGSQGRQGALNFAYHGKTAYGASVDESLQELQVASKSAQVSFKELSGSLKEVSDSAGKAGVNAQQARAEYTQLLNTAIKNGYGSQATNAAQLNQEAKNSLGRDFQDVDMSQRLGQSSAYMASAISGMSVSQYLTATPTQRAGADQARDTAAIKAVLRPGVEEWIKEQIGRSGGKVSQEMAAQIGEELLVKFYPNDPYALAMAVGTMSSLPDLAKSPQKAATWIVQQYATGGVMKSAAQKMTAADEKKQKATSQKNDVASGVGENMRATQNDKGPGAGKSILGDLDREHSGGFLGFGGHNSDAYNAYQSWHKKGGGQEDPVIYNLLNKVKNDDKAKVVVSTKDGKKVVSFADAIKRHRNELASGKAVILEEGKKQGKSVKDIVGEDNVDPLRDYSKEAKATESAGESFASWEKKHTTKDKKGNTKLELGLTAEARRLLTVLDNTGVAGASATATPPLSPYASNPSWQD